MAPPHVNLNCLDLEFRVVELEQGTNGLFEFLVIQPGGVRMGEILLEIGEGILVAMWFILPMFVVFPLTQSAAVSVFTVVLSLIGLSVYLWMRI